MWAFCFLICFVGSLAPALRVLRTPAVFLMCCLGKLATSSAHSAWSRYLFLHVLGGPATRLCVFWALLLLASVFFVVVFLFFSALSGPASYFCLRFLGSCATLFALSGSSCCFFLRFLGLCLEFVLIVGFLFFDMFRR